LIAVPPVGRPDEDIRGAGAGAELAGSRHDRAPVATDRHGVAEIQAAIRGAVRGEQLRLEAIRVDAIPSITVGRPEKHVGGAPGKRVGVFERRTDDNRAGVSADADGIAELIADSTVVADASGITGLGGGQLRGLDVGIDDQRVTRTSVVDAQPELVAGNFEPALMLTAIGIDGDQPTVGERALSILSKRHATRTGIERSCQITGEVEGQRQRTAIRTCGCAFEREALLETERAIDVPLGQRTALVFHTIGATARPCRVRGLQRVAATVSTQCETPAIGSSRELDACRRERCRHRMVRVVHAQHARPLEQVIRAFVFTYGCGDPRLCESGQGGDPGTW
jgi:hypothetical protein